MEVREEGERPSAMPSASPLCSWWGFLGDALTQRGKGSCGQNQSEKDLPLVYPCYPLGWLLEVLLELTFMKYMAVY